MGQVADRPHPVLITMFTLSWAGLALLVAVGIASGAFKAAVVAGIVLIVTVLTSSGWVPALAALAALLAGFPLAAFLAMLSAISRVLWRTGGIRNAERARPEELAASVDRVVAQLGLSSDVASPLSAHAILELAVRTAPRDSRLREVPVVDVGYAQPAASRELAALLEPSPVAMPATQLAGEACLLTEVVAEKLEVPITLDICGGCAAFVLSTADRVPDGYGVDLLRSVTGAHSFQLAEALSEFAERGGGPLLRRVSRARWSRRFRWSA